jgi:hypothetical protein
LLLCGLSYGWLWYFIPFGEDHTLFFAPLLAQRWQTGAGLWGVPLWCPWPMLGAPWTDNLQSLLLYPPRWLFWWLPDWRLAYGPWFWLHYVLAAGGMLAWLRALGLRRAACVAGTLALVLGGHFAGRLINPALLLGECWYPWLFYGASGRSGRQRAALVIAAAMLAAIGSPHVLLYGLLGVVLVSGSTVWGATQWGATQWRVKSVGSEPRPTALALRELLVRAGWTALGLVWGLPTLLPGLRRIGSSVRAGADLLQVFSDALQFGQLPLALLGGSGSSIHPEFIDRSLYLGAPALLLIALHVALGRPWRMAAWRLGTLLTLAGLGLALGPEVGLDKLLAAIPGGAMFSGPLRALGLAAPGLALLLACAVHDAPNWLSRKWLPALWAALGCIGVGTFAWAVVHARGGALLELPAMLARESVDQNGWMYGALHGGLLLLLGGLLLGLMRRRATHWAALVLLGVLVLDWLHFMPRVAPPLRTRGEYGPPPSAAWLQAQNRPGQAPQRVLGFDPLRYGNAQLTGPRALPRLMANSAGLYGLEEIQGFDPLLPKAYAQLAESFGGRAPFNDPLRYLDLAQPDPSLLKLLGVRYLVGNPGDRRLTNLPQALSADQPEALVSAWRAELRAVPVTAWHCVTLVDDGEKLARGTAVARLELQADEGDFAVPLRLELDTDEMRAQMVRWQTAPIYTQWEAVERAGGERARKPMANYAGRLEFGRPLHIRAARWRLLRNECTLFIASQGYRIAMPPSEAAQWRRTWSNGKPRGAEEEIYELISAPPRAQLLAMPAPGAAPGKTELTLSTDSLLTTASMGRVTWQAYSANASRLRTTATGPALLLLREASSPDWLVRVDGQPAAALRVNGLLRAVALPPGEHTVDWRFRPRLFLGLLGLNLCLLCAGTVAWGVRRRRRQKP